LAEEYDFLFKSIVVGDGGVGKTALTLRFSKGFFTEDYKMTIGVDFHVKTIELETEEGPISCKLQLWDTGGQERFSSIRPMYYRGSLGAVLVFDLTNYASFEHLPQWIEEVRANIKNEIPLLLVGNKSDLIDQRTISIKEINQFTKDFNLYYMETSAKTGDGVGDCFYILACLMIDQAIPKQLIANNTVFPPGQVTLSIPIMTSKPIAAPEPQLDYVAPPVPEPTAPERVTPIETLPKEPEFEFEAPPVPEPATPKQIAPIELLSEEPEFEFEAPPVPEPKIELQEKPEIKTPESKEIEFKTPEEILSQINKNEEVESITPSFPIPTSLSSPKDYKPKSVPFSSKAPSPVPAPEGFQKSIIPSQKEDPSAPFRVSKREEPIKPKPASMDLGPTQEIPPERPFSQSLTDYMPQETDLKKKKKHLLKQKQEKEEKLKITREKQEQLIDAMKKSKKPKKEKKDELREQKSKALTSSSLFQTLSQNIDDNIEETSRGTFIPFVSSDESSKEESSSLRIIPNVTDIENETSSFTAFTPTQTENKQIEPEKSKELLVCKQCGATLSSDYAFCNKCGSKL
jgi:small GTP-binding protein